MISRLTLKNFTVFKEADFQFAPGLNVIIGENGTGKSHVLKAAYAALAVMSRGANRNGSAMPPDKMSEWDWDKKLRGVFQIETAGELVRRPVRTKALHMLADFGAEAGQLTGEIKTVGLGQITELPNGWLGPLPVFLPTRELLSIFPGFVSLYDTREVAFDETWRDTCNLLGLSRLKGERLEQVRPLLEAVEQALGGTIQLEKDHFEMITKAGTFRAPLMAEGQAKLGMVAYLIANGSLAAGSTLFWDEPESNLNYKVLKRVARTILDLCKLGVQIILSTHSMFLLRELYILHQGPEFVGISTHFIGLSPGKAGVKVEQGETEEDIGEAVAVHEELSQSDRYMEVESGHANAR